MKLITTIFILFYLFYFIYFILFYLFYFILFYFIFYFYSFFKTETINRQRSLFDQQVQILEDKYQSVKQINLQLEVSIYKYI